MVSRLSSPEGFGRPPALAWRAGLLLLPVIVLAITGTVFLHRDAALIQAEARRQADEILGELRSLVSLPLEFEVQTKGRPTVRLSLQDQACTLPLDRLRFPRDDPQFQLDQRGIFWRVAQRHGTVAYPPPYDPVPQPVAPTPDSLAALAQYRRACNLAAEPGRQPEAISLFNALASSAQVNQTESGLPIKTLAQYARFRLTRDTTEPASAQDAAWHDLVAQVIWEPSALSPKILEDISLWLSGKPAPSSVSLAFQDWSRVWQLHEEARQLQHGLGHQASAWLTIGQRDWLTYRLRQGDWEVVLAQSADATQAMLQDMTRRLSARTNVWQAELVLTGRPFSIPPRSSMKSSVTNGAVLQSWSASPRDVPSAFPLMKLQVQLARPEVYYAQHRQRRLWVGWLIGLSAVVAMVGLWSTWQAFQRQVRLATLKSDFVSSVSHELRAPLAAIQLLVDSLERGLIRDESRRQQYHALIGRECRRLGNLIENVLDFSRIERHRLRYELEPTDLVSLVQDTVAVLSPQAQERQVHLVLQVDERFQHGQGLEVPCDGKAIQQALVNLIDNAIKHSPPEAKVTVGLEVGESAHEADSSGAQPLGAQNGGKEQAASCEPTVPPGGHCSVNAHYSRAVTKHCSPRKRFMSWEQARKEQGATPEPTGWRLWLWVADQGPGIPAEDHERIFEPFFRRGSELRRETQGVGIGLSIVKHIIESHQGRIQVQSEPGQGARFIIELPVPPPAEPDPR